MKSTKYFKKSFSSKVEKISVAIFISCLVLGILAYLITPSGWSWTNLLLSLSVALFQLFLGILIVNIYLENREKDGIFRASFNFINQEIITFHNHLKRLLSREFGYNGYRRLNEEFESYDKESKKMSDHDIYQYILAISKDNYELKKLYKEMDECVRLFDEIISITTHVDKNAAITECVLSAKKLYTQFKSLDIKKESDHRLLFEVLEKFDDETLRLLGLLCITPDVRDWIFGSRIHHNW